MSSQEIANQQQEAINSLIKEEKHKAEVQRKGLCFKCEKRPGTMKWGDALAMTHGFSQMICEICALEAQITHAKERAAALPEMQERLDELLKAESK